ncbi:MAG TPA: tetratricopeptide repeat protein [Thermoplasmata archaeon]|nr:tetratricopeptide repeat protein [Thermoplasmata archaeon]
MPGAGSLRAGAVPPIFGRSDVLAEIDRTLERARSGAGDALLISGDDGAGKSLFVRASVARAREHGFRSLTGRALPEEIPQPFSLVRDLVRPLAPSAEHSAGAADPVLPIFLVPYGTNGASAPYGSVEAGEPATEAEGLDAVLAPLDSPGEWLGTSRNELFARITQYLTDLARDEPLLLAIDDLHFADPSSLEFLARFVATISDRRIALVATVAAGSRIPSQVREALESLTRSSVVRTVPLGRLSTADVAEFARWVRRGLAPDPADVLRWHAQTEGNPLFVEQLVRSSSGLGARAPATPTDGSADLNQLLLARARRLSEVERRTLTYASLLGREFAIGTLQAIGEMDEERLTEVVDRLVQDGELRERDAETLEFTTEGLRAGVYAELTQTRRRILHRRVARALEERHLATDFELARQFYLGRDDAKAAEYNARAAVSAMRAFAFESAVPYLERALEAERRRPDRALAREVHLLTELGRAFDELGDLRRSETALSEAVALARRSPELDAELGRVLLALAQTRQDQSEFASAEALAREAYGRLEARGSPRELMTAHRVLGIVNWRLGQIAPAEEHLRLALELAEREGTSIEQGHALIDVANALLLGETERFGEALTMYERAAELFGSGQDLSARARVLMNRAVLLYSTGRSEEALEGLDRAIEAAERSKSPIWIGYCYLNLAQMRAELGQPDRARPALERAESLLLPLGDRLAPEQIALVHGLLAEAERDWDRAQRYFEDALRQARELGAEPDVGEMLFRLAHLDHARGDDASARAHLAAARASGVDRQRSDLAGRVARLDVELSRSPDPSA